MTKTKWEGKRRQNFIIWGTDAVQLSIVPSSDNIQGIFKQLVCPDNMQIKPTSLEKMGNKLLHILELVFCFEVRSSVSLKQSSKNSRTKALT